MYRLGGLVRILPIEIKSDSAARLNFAVRHAQKIAEVANSLQRAGDSVDSPLGIAEVPEAPTPIKTKRSYVSTEIPFW